MGRQHQGMDRPGVRQVPEGSGERGKMEKTGCKIICGVPTTLAVKGLMMMMMIDDVEVESCGLSRLLHHRNERNLFDAHHIFHRTRLVRKVRRPVGSQRIFS